MDQIMNLYIYDKTHRLVAVIDAYTSLIWSDRYTETGDFELSLPYIYGNTYFGEFLKQDNYCGIDYSKRKMIIEKIEYKHDEDSPPEMVISGRSLESILERRIIPSKTEFGTEESPVNMQNSFKSLINSHIINPSNTKRKIDNFIFQDSTDTNVTSVTFYDSYDGDNLYDAIQGNCDDKKIGFKITFNDNWQMVFQLYAGKDRSMSQNSNSYVIFSPAYDNLKNSNYFSTTEEFKNVAYIGVDESSTEVACLDESDEAEGLARREIFLNESELKENSKTTLNTEQRKKKAVTELKKEYKIKTGIEGEIVPDVLYEYGTDYDVGDKVQLTDIYGNSDVVRISEVVISCDENGLTIIPTFEELEPK